MPGNQISAPVVSVIMANYRGERFLQEAIQSVLEQTVSSLEIIVSDDGSDDASTEIVSRIAATDDRVRLIQGIGNTGPGATRNRALAIAQGEWIAIVDSDDLMKPNRFQSLIELAEARNCAIAADDLTYFGSVQAEGTTLFGALAVPEIITSDELIQTEVGASTLPKLGYLKPIIRRTALNGLTYNKALRVGEDFDLLLRLLLNGAKMTVTRDSFYLYRRHGSSISHRLSEEKVAAMIAAQKKLMQEVRNLPLPTVRLLSLRLQMLENMLAYERLVARIKQRDVAGALRSLARRPALAKDLAQSLSENLTRRLSKTG